MCLQYMLVYIYRCIAPITMEGCADEPWKKCKNFEENCQNWLKETQKGMSVSRHFNWSHSSSYKSERSESCVILNCRQNHKDIVYKRVYERYKTTSSFWFFNKFLVIQPGKPTQIIQKKHFSKNYFFASSTFQYQNSAIKGTKELII